MLLKKKFVAGLAAIFALIVLFLTIEHFRGKWGLARWKARMAAKGEPLTIGTVTTPLPPANQNGMPALIVAAGQTYPFPWRVLPPVHLEVSGRRIVITRLAEWPTEGRQSTNVTWEVLGQALKSREDAFNAAVKALASPKFNAALDYYSGWETYLPHVYRLRHLERMLNAAGLHRFRNSLFDEGVEFLAAAIRLPAVLCDEAFTISHDIRMIIAREAFETTWQAAHVDGLTDANLKELQQVWIEHDFLSPLRRPLTMEHVMASHEYHRMRRSEISLFQWLDGGMSSAPRSFTITSPFDIVVTAIERTPDILRNLRNDMYSPLWKFAWSYQDELRFVKTVERGLHAWDAAIAQQSATPLQPLGEAEYRDLMETSDPTEQTTMRYMLSPRAARFFPVMKSAFKAQTLRELAVTGLAIKRYELRYGKPPASLDALVPEFLSTLPRDFMDGNVLKYTLTPDGPILYSVGADGNDDGGQVKDILWPLPASPDELKQGFYR